MHLLLVLVLLLAASPAWATDYFISPTGSNANNGLASGAPWATFAHALANGWGCGDRLFLANGTYTSANSGMVNLDGVTCTAGNEIQLHATNERQALISHDGNNGVAVRINNSSYVVLQGIQARSADNDYLVGSSQEYGEPLAIYGSDHVTVKRGLFHHNNRYGNNHLVDVQNSNNILLEENEAYFFHRHAFAAVGSHTVTWRRNYCHARGVGGVAGGHPSALDSVGASMQGGDDCIVGYPVRDSIMENNICDDDLLKCMEIEASGEIEGDNNQFLGNISYRNYLGHGARNRDVLDETQPHNTTVKHNVVINSWLRPYQFHGAVGTIFENNTAINTDTGTATDQAMQFVQDIGPTDSTLTGKNNLVNGVGAATYDLDGLYINFATWTMANTNVFGANPNFTPSSDPNYTNKTSIDPEMGACYLWIPDGTPMKGAGVSGADIGATILYRYENATLTATPLWNTSTGAFPCGAIVTGLNDVAGQSCFDVHERLHVNSGGCSFPAGFGSAPSSGRWIFGGEH
jgi:hypothetical protein